MAYTSHLSTVQPISHGDPSAPSHPQHSSCPPFPRGTAGVTRARGNGGEWAGVAHGKALEEKRCCHTSPPSRVGSLNPQGGPLLSPRAPGLSAAPCTVSSGPGDCCLPPKRLLLPLLFSSLLSEDAVVEVWKGAFLHSPRPPQFCSSAIYSPPCATEAILWHRRPPGMPCEPQGSGK